MKYGVQPIDLAGDEPDNGEGLTSRLSGSN